MRRTNKGQSWGKHLDDKYPSEYYAWTNMKTRCYNKNYHLWKDYGGRGIEVCSQWRNGFEAFLSDLGPKPFPNAILDRIDNNKHYWPGNVRWINAVESSRNRRNVPRFTFCGETKTLPEWEVHSPVQRKVIWRRLKDGWHPSAAIFLPPQSTRRFDRTARVDIVRDIFEYRLK
jgi:hypothetical protein